MKAKLIAISWLGVLTAALIIISAFNAQPAPYQNHHELPDNADQLKEEALQILDAKCNVCHRKQNPFMVFNEGNISKKARKIYQLVFVDQRMPKGNEVRLTEGEYDQLEKWLKTQKIY